MSKQAYSQFEAIPESLLVVNREGSIVFANRHAHRLLAYGDGELVGRPIEALIPARYRGRHAGHVRAFFADPLVRPMGAGRAFQALRGDGHELTLEIALGPMADGQLAAAVIRDLSERDRLEAELRRSEERYQSLVADSHELLFCVELDTPIPLDAPELEQVALLQKMGRFVEANDAFASAYGTTRDRVIGMRLGEVLPEDRPESVASLLAIVRAGYLVRDAETVEHAVDGSERVFLNTFTATIENGKVSRAWGTSRDVTAERQIERQLRRQNRELERLRKRLSAESEYLQQEIRSEHGFEEIVGNSAEITATLKKVEQVAGTNASVLLLGETGTGKELLARAIHARSRRKGHPLIKVDCTNLPPGLVESELFGHEKGAFSGAHETRPGRFELADDGTIFLDEIGELAVELQQKLLRVLEDGEFERLGSRQTRRTNVRVVAATNRDLRKEVEEGRFRADLYHRLSVFPVEIPPLRDRRADIPLLASSFITASSKAFGKRIDSVEPSSMDRLVVYDWPGNVRELRNVIERSVILSPGSILRVHDALGGLETQPSDPAPSLKRTLEATEREKIVRALDACDWKIKGEGNAASRLGLKPSTLRSRMRRLGITRP